MADPIHRGALDPAQLDALRERVRDIEAWPAGSHVWGHYEESTPRGVAICRTENVSACDTTTGALVAGPLYALATAALGEPAVAFKDKLNYKHPGGGGFLPHQDRVAYPGVERVMSLLVAIDECTIAAGCLWLARGVDDVLPVDGRGVVRDDIGRALVWEPAELAPGDAVCIDGLAPHRSDANTSDHARRVFVASYAPAREHYDREDYYAARARVMTAASRRDGRDRISTLADFAGDQVVPATIASDRCTHS